MLLTLEASEALGTVSYFLTSIKKLFVLVMWVLRNSTLIE
ncbi:hypothetical protein NRI_0688 [Neorickettsia risticii str. Illinois]|uniref:Uncharacterized protein n=1 Tax=Neorickettsia risticii (strain Illinois) TaxID=434131 RepID=C6V5J5_NEORI|nr:hypothetical protein NRI_0688 [Neorickettsia risticii str. Illinois]